MWKVTVTYDGSRQPAGLDGCHEVGCARAHVTPGGRNMVSPQNYQHKWVYSPPGHDILSVESVELKQIAIEMLTSTLTLAWHWVAPARGGWRGPGGCSRPRQGVAGRLGRRNTWRTWRSHCCLATASWRSKRWGWCWTAGVGDGTSAGKLADIETGAGSVEGAGAGAGALKKEQQWLRSSSTGQMLTCGTLLWESRAVRQQLSLYSSSWSWWSSWSLLSNRHCTLNTVYCTLYTVHCTLNTVYCILYTVYCIL